MTPICLKQYLLCSLLLYRSCDISKSSGLRETSSMNSPLSHSSGKFEAISTEKICCRIQNTHKHKMAEKPRNSATVMSQCPKFVSCFTCNVNTSCLHHVLLSVARAALLPVWMGPYTGHLVFGAKITLMSSLHHTKEDGCNKYAWSA